MNFPLGEIMAGTLLGVLFLLIFVLASVVRAVFPLRAEWSRKTSHLLGGLVALSFPYFIHDDRIIAIMCVLFLLLLVLSKKLGKLRAVHDVDRFSWGAYLFPVAIFLIYVLAKDKIPLYFISILVLSVSDTAAALIGGRYGSLKIPVEGNLKSLEGSVAFAVVTFLCVEIPLLLMTNLGKPETILLALIVALLVTGFELIALSGTDNLFIPLGVFYIANRLPGYPFAVYLNTLFELGLSVVLVVALTGWNKSLRIGWKITMILFLFASQALCGVWWAVSATVFVVILAALYFYYAKTGRRESLEVTAALKVSVLPVIPIFISAALNDPQRGYKVFLTALCSVGILAAYDTFVLEPRAAAPPRVPSDKIVFYASLVMFPLGLILLPVVVFPRALPLLPLLVLVLAGTAASILLYLGLQKARGLGRLTETFINKRDWAVGFGCLVAYLISLAWKNP